MKILSKITNNKNLITTFIFVIIGIIYSIYIHSNICINNGFLSIKYQIFYWILAIALIAILGVIVYKILSKKEIKAHILFLILATIFGICYLIIAPIYNGSDEVAHTYRVFEVATGHITTPQNEEGTYIEKDLPKSFLELSKSNNKDASIKIHDIPEKISIELNEEDKTNINANTGTSVYSPIIYLPQAIGMFIGFLLNLNPFLIVNLARIFIFIVWMLVCAYAIKIMPTKKGFFLLLALLPSNLTSAVTLSADTMLNAFAMLLIAKVFELMSREDNITKKDYSILLISSIIIGQCKMAYIPLIVLCLIIPSKRYKNKKQFAIGSSVIIILALIFSLLWSTESGKFYSSTGVEQQAWILSNPINYIIVMFRTFVESFDTLFYGVAAGNSLYQTRVGVPSIISLGMMICLIMSLFVEKNETKIKIWKKVFTVGIMGCMALLVVTAMYVSATTILTGQVGTATILGLQGRYFIPIIMLSVFLVKNKYINMEEKYLYVPSMIFVYAVILHTLATFI